jgi:hypothetical protein
MLKSNNKDKNEFIYLSKASLKAKPLNESNHTMYEELDNVFSKYNEKLFYKYDFNEDRFRNIKSGEQQNNNK